MIKPVINGLLCAGLISVIQSAMDQNMPMWCAGVTGLFMAGAFILGRSGS